VGELSDYSSKLSSNLTYLTHNYPLLPEYKAQILVLCPLRVAWSKYQTIDYIEFGGCTQKKDDKERRVEANLRFSFH
jgi:hypothetical protein